MSKNNQIIEKKPVYIKSITLKEVNCFQEEQIFNFKDKESKPANWTVILGNNNTGKTTILRAIALMQVERFSEDINSTEFSLITQYYGIFDNFFEIKALLSNLNDESYPIEYSSTLNKRRSLFEKYFEGDFQIFAYGINRKPSKYKYKENTYKDFSLSTETLFNDEAVLINFEEWLLQLDYATKKGNIQAKNRLVKLKEILTSEIFPDISDFRFETSQELKNLVEFKTDFGWIKFNDLGYGYQATLAWIADFIKNLFDKYPKSENPLKEPAIVLIDEIDLHLHPEWQRKITGFLSNLFPKTQFIVTSHSPLVVQSVENINIILLRKEGNKIIVNQPEKETFKGWSVEEILTDLMQLDEKVYSDDYLKYIKQFEDALDNEDYKQGKDAYEKLEEILHPESHLRKLLRIQMSSLVKI